MLSELNSVYLPTLENYSYSAAKVFSRNLDQKLGFRIEEVEERILLSSPHTPWAGLDPQALQTPYPEIRMILSLLGLRAGERIIDLGAGYGRMGMMVGHFFPGVFFEGYEISQERAKEGSRLLAHFQNSKLHHDDISRSSWMAPEADVYFIYDFGDLESILRVVEKLKQISMKKPIRVVGRGRRTRDHVERNEPWLSQVHSPLHCGNFSIYRAGE